MSEKILTTADIARMFKVSPVTALNWCNAGLFKGARLVDYPRGKVWEIPFSATVNFVKPQRGRPADPEPTATALAKRRSRPLKNAKNGGVNA